MEKNEDIEGIFKKRLLNAEAPISPRVWEAIKNTLPEETLLPVSPSKKPFYKNYFILAISSIVLFSSLIYFVFPKTKDEDSLSTEYKRSSDSLFSSKGNFNLIEFSDKKYATVTTEDKSLANDKSFIIKNKELESHSTASSANDKEEISPSNVAFSSSLNAKNRTSVKAKKGLDLNDNQNNKESTTMLETGFKEIANGSPRLKKVIEQRVFFTNTQFKPANTLSEFLSIPSKSNNYEVDDSSFVESSTKVTSEIIDSDAPNRNDTVLSKEFTPNNLLKKSDSVDYLKNKMEDVFFSTANKVKVNSDSVNKASLDTLVLEELIIDTLVFIDSSSIQDQPIAIKKSLGRFSLDVVATPLLTGVSSKALDESFAPQVASKKQQGKNDLNFSIGVHLNYLVASKWSLSGGIMVAGYSERYKFQNTVYEERLVYTPITSQDSLNTVIGTDTSVQSFSSSYESLKRDSYTQISVPLSISYTLFSKQRLSFFATAGARVNFLTNGVTYVSNEKGTDLQPLVSGFSKINVSYMASLGFSYAYTTKLSFLAIPVVNILGGSVLEKNAPISQRPYSIGLSLGVRLQF